MPISINNLDSMGGHEVYQGKYGVKQAEIELV